LPAHFLLFAVLFEATLSDLIRRKLWNFDCFLSEQTCKFEITVTEASGSSQNYSVVGNVLVLLPRGFSLLPCS